MSYTPVPTGGIEPPHDGATTRCLPTWLSRQKIWSRKQGSNLRLTRRMKPPLYRLSYSAVLKVAAPLGFEPSRPSSKPGALPARRRGNAVEPRAGFEPAPSDLKDRCPRPLDERGNVGAGSENRTRIVCLEDSGSAIELCPQWRMVQGSNLRDPKGLDALASRCLTARPTIRNRIGALGVTRTPDPPLRRRPLSSAELRGQLCATSNPGIGRGE